jgi:single-strand DNA-binding protein
MKMLGGREGMGGGAEDAGERSYGERPQPASRPAAAARPAPKSSTGFDNMDDDIPF